MVEKDVVAVAEGSFLTCSFDSKPFADSYKDQQACIEDA